MSEKRIKVGLVQQHNSGDVADNMNRLKQRIEQCAHKGPSLSCYKSCTTASTSAKPSRPTASTWPNPFRVPRPSSTDDWQPTCTSCWSPRSSSAGLPGLYHNTAVVFDTDGSMAGKYRKMHIPDDPAYYEKFYFTPGDLGFTPVKTSIGTLGVLVCWDQWYPEAARLMALQGADPAHLPHRHRLGELRHPRGTEAPAGGLDHLTTWTCRSQRPAGDCRQPGGARARPLATDPAAFSSGDTVSCAARRAKCLPTAPSDSEWCQVVDIDLARSENVRRWWPFLRDRRIDATTTFYAGLSTDRTGCRIVPGTPFRYRRDGPLIFLGGSSLLFDKKRR